MKRDKSSSAFTLMEILIVVATISVIAAILFPVLATTRSKARQTSCLSNLHQIGIAFALYRQDNDEQYPVAVDTREQGVFFWHTENATIQQGLRNAPTLRVALNAYVSTKEAWRCPSDTGGYTAFNRAADKEDVIEVNSKNSFYDNLDTSYFYRAEAGYVGVIENAKAVDVGGSPLSLPQLALLTDGNRWHLMPPSDADKNPPAGLRNVLFADGHIKALSQYQFGVSWLGNLGVK